MKTINTIKLTAKNKRLSKTLAVIFVVVLLLSIAITSVGAEEYNYFSVINSQLDRSYFYQGGGSSFNSSWDPSKKTAWRLSCDFSQAMNFYIVSTNIEENLIDQMEYLYQNNNSSEAAAFGTRWNTIWFEVQHLINATKEICSNGGTSSQAQNLCLQIQDAQTKLNTLAQEITESYHIRTSSYNYTDVGGDLQKGGIVLLNSLWQGLGDMLKNIGTNSINTNSLLGMSWTANDIEGIANIISSVMKTFAYAIACILFGINVTTTSLGSSNCDLFSFATYIYVSAKSEKELQDLVEYIKLTASRHQVVVDILTGASMQEEGWKTVLPFANPSTTKDGSYIGQPFYLPTDEVANFIPFSYLNIINPTGIGYGLNSITNTPIIIDRSEAMNGNGFTLGTSGSGKSMFTKAEFFSAMMKYTNDEFFIIDPENEYRALAEATEKVPFKPFDAEIIKLSPNTNTYVNIFDTDLSYSEDGSSAVTMKSDFIMTFCEAAKGFSLTATERSIIDRCVKIVYKEYIKTNDKSKTPTLPQFYDTLKHQPEKEAEDIALSLELFVSGSFNIFSHPTNVKYHKNIIIWDIFELGEQLKTVGLLVLLETLWQRVIENKHKGIRTWVWTDEFSIMFNDNASEVFRTGEFFEKIYKRIRKHGGIASGATQNISEVIQSKQAMTMLQNSEFLVLLAQKDEDLSVLKQMLNLSDAQAKYIDTDEPGKGLIKLGKRIIPFENKIPKSSLMYKICSTKFKETN